MAKFSVFVLVVFTFFLFSISVFAQTDPTFGLKPAAEQVGGYDTSVSGENTLLNTIQKIVSIFLSLIGIVFILIMLYAGVRWLTSRGKEELIEKSKTAMEAALTGLVLVLISYGLTKFVFSMLMK